MRYFKKNAPPESLIQWLTDYEDALKRRYNSHRPIKNIWQEFGTPLDIIDLSDTEQIEAIKQTDLINDEFDTSLLKEQGYICCYCGKRIPEKKIVREHFKDKSHHRDLVFQYSNLFAACEGGKEEPFSIGQNIRLRNGETIEINGFEDVVRVLQQNLPYINIDTIKNHRENAQIELKKGNKIYFPNPPHCDSSKSDKRDLIVNPSTQVDCEYWFIYEQEESTKIKVTEHNGDNKALVSKTIEVLNLNADTLKSHRHRLTAFQKGNGKVTEMFDTFSTINDYEERIAVVKDYIENEVYAKTDDKLDPFCFVTASVVWNSFL